MRQPKQGAEKLAEKSTDRRREAQKIGQLRHEKMIVMKRGERRVSDAQCYSQNLKHSTETEK